MAIIQKNTAICMEKLSTVQTPQEALQEILHYEETPTAKKHRGLDAEPER